ncbi:hypothetical protein QL285_094926 [Trifolium repens]|nr:hypothetical protein QL285_094926 [Trifolium repens]
MWSQLLRIQRNRFLVFIVSQKNFMVTHIYREGNQVADLMANHGLSFLPLFFDLISPCLLGTVMLETNNGFLILEYVLLRWGFGLVPILYIFSSSFNTFWGG